MTPQNPDIITCELIMKQYIIFEIQRADESKVSLFSISQNSISSCSIMYICIMPQEINILPSKWIILFIYTSLISFLFQFWFCRILKYSKWNIWLMLSCRDKKKKQFVFLFAKINVQFTTIHLLFCFCVIKKVIIFLVPQMNSNLVI